MILFLALLTLAQAPATSTDELVKKLDGTAGLKDRDKPFEIAASLARLYVSRGRTDEGRAFYAQALKKAEPVRAFYAQKRRAAGARPLPEAAAVGCAPGPDTTLESLFAKAKAKGADALGAAACARAALLGTKDVDLQVGNLLFVQREYDQAQAAFTLALDTFPEHWEARYARAALLLDLKGDDVRSLTQVKAELERVVKEAPGSPRKSQASRLLERATAALEKGGMSKLPQVVAAAAPPPAPAVQPPQLNPEVVKAFQDVPRTPEMEQNFEKLIDEGEEHLARGRLNEARAAYLQVMPYQPNNPRLRAGMAWAMIRLNRQPMADNVWRAAVETPEAVSALGDTLKAKGDADGAKAVWSKLKESVPAWGPRLEGKL